MLFYTERTEGYRGQEIKGVDRIVKVDCTHADALRAERQFTLSQL